MTLLFQKRITRYPRAHSSPALPVFGPVCMLAAIEFDDQVPVSTNEVDVIPADRLLPVESCNWRTCSRQVAGRGCVTTTRIPLA
jgi:hypothetical protein